MKSKEFKEAYSQLNTEQKKAVDTIDGPVMVIAGPGTGKTQILTLRIANILLETDIEPEQILALTFTESGVLSMRKRLAELIGSDAYHVTISTFHGFSNDIIQNNPEEFPHIIGARSITDVDQISLIQDIVMELELSILKPSGDTYYYVRHVNSAISELKREGVSVEAFLSIIENAEKDFQAADDVYHEKGAHKGKMKGKYKDVEKQITKNRELALIYARYQELLRTRKQYDYNDMIMETLHALQNNEDLLLRLQEEYQYILVDEHQDTNNAQNKIMELLSAFHAPNPNLFVVGDEKQSIFRFQGANLENFYYFKHLYPHATLISLKENYRSTQSILDSAHSLIPTPTELHANVGYSSKPIDIYSFTESRVEEYFVARDIQRLINDGVDPEEIAILYRNNKDAFPIARILEKNGIAYRIESDEDLFSDPDVKKLLTLMYAIDNFGDDVILADALHIDYFDLDPLDVVRIIRSASQKKKYDLFDVLHDKKMLDNIELVNREAIEKFYTNLAVWVKQAKNTDVFSFLEILVRESGMLQALLGSDTVALRLASLDRFFDEVRGVVSGKPDAQLSDLLRYIETIRTHGLFIKKKKSIHSGKCVRLMTAHRSKGLEFEYVIIMGVVNGKWGNGKQRDYLPLLPEVYTLTDGERAEDDEENMAYDDDRRLFYVALTRAKKNVTILYPRQNNEGKELLPSQFIEEINEAFKEVIDAHQIEKEFEENKALVFTETKKVAHSLKDREFVSELFEKQGMSVSALNNYLECPWKYFYRNLIRIPEKKAAHLMYGTAIHDTLEWLFKKLRFDEAVSKEMLLETYRKRLLSEPFSTEDETVYIKRGEEALAGWFDEYSERFIAETLTEFAIRGVLLDDVRLTGKLDKLEKLNETEVNVVDYKTGKPKTRNDILGKTKNSEGNIYRQLVFYRLLLELFKDGKYTMVSGEIDFIEPDPKTEKYRKEKFVVEDADVDDLKETITRVAQEIRTLSFWDSQCDDKECRYCTLRDMMKK